VRYRILGPVALAHRDGLMAVNAGRERTVLAVLVLHANQVVTADSLIQALWEGDPPSTARAQIHNSVSRVRRLLVATGAPPDALTTVPGGYHLRVAPDDADHVVFGARLRAARGAVAAGDLDLARAEYRAALALWRGPTMSDVAADIARLGAARLDEERVAAAEEYADIELRLGHVREVLPELTDLVQRNPLRERPLAQLMTALVMVGREADALSAYREGRRRFAGELGIEPGPELQELHRRILNRDEPAPPGVAAVAPVAGAPGAAPAAPPAQAPPPRSLPRPIGDFTGREALVAQLDAALDGVEPALIAIDGMAGAGKTTLAVHVAARVADRYPDGHLYLDLHGHSECAPVEPVAALNLLLGQLGVPTAQLPAGLEERAARWRTEVAHRRVLILLDNAADSGQVAPLLPGPTRSAVLVTSRRRLARLQDARRISLDLLRPPEAVLLLARMVGDEAVAAQPDAAAEVARRCGYLPLALRIAGARLATRPSWTLRDLAVRLDAAEPPLVELAVEGSTVAAAFTLSYRQLPAPTQRMFGLVGQHPGPDFGEDAAAALADRAPIVSRELLDELIDAHLLEQPAMGRYRLHDLLREYAQRLPPPADADAAAHRLVAYYVHTTVNASAWFMRGTLLSDADWGPKSPYARDFADHDAGLAWLLAEWRGTFAVARMALERGWYREACLLSLALWPLLFRRSNVEELAALQEQVVAAAAELDDEYLVGLTHHYLAGSYVRTAIWSASIRHIERALVIWQKTGYQRGEVAALSNYIQVLVRTCRFRDAISQGLRAVQLAEGVARDSSLARSHVSTGWAYRMIGDYAAALRHVRLAVAMYRRFDDPGGFAIALADLGRVHTRLGHLTVAGAMLDRAVSLKRAGGNTFGAAEALSDRGVVYLRAGRQAEALACQREALDSAPPGGDPQIEALLHNNLAATLSAGGEPALALVHARAALDIAQRADCRYEQARAHARIAAALPDDPIAAFAHWRQALAMHTEMGTPERREASEQVRKLAGMTPAG
jgi:DNA-binding SARP family transcriptional activator/tetratricopeptide (TPR) repeat protein